MGESRGHWEGHTHIVETTSLSKKTHCFGSFESRHIVELFTCIDADMINYELTVETP